MLGTIMAVEKNAPWGRRLSAPFGLGLLVIKACSGSREEKHAVKTFAQMVNEAAATVPGISPAEAYRRQQESGALIIDVRDLADRRASGMVEGAIPISSGTLPIRADTEVPEEWRDSRLQDRSRPVITVCDLGPMSAIAAKVLKDMGFTDVAYVVGGTLAWQEAGFPCRPPSDA